MKESLTNEPPKTTVPGPEAAGGPGDSQDGLAQLRALEAELQGGKTSSPSAKPEGNSDTGRPDSGGSPGAGGDTLKRRRKFKKVPPENTIRLTIRQYWRLRDWMARRALGLPGEYAGVFIQGKDGILVEPLVEPVIGCLDAYLPEEWVVFIEDKSPVLMLLLALFEAEQTFGGAVSQAAAELKAQKTTQPGSAPAESERPKMPSLNETTGKVAKVTA